MFFKIRRDWEFCRKYKMLGAFGHHIIVFGLKGIHPRHPPREFPLGLRAPVLGMGTAQIPGNEPFPFLVGERILLSPARCLGSCSLRSHPAKRDRAHPTRPHKPLSVFSVLVWCVAFAFDLGLHTTQALVFFF